MSLTTVILAGGRGTRLAEETSRIPKPMVEVGGKPILTHIMQIYARCGFNRFLVACGYRGDIIKQYFKDYYLYASDWTVDLRSGDLTIDRTQAPDWTVSLADTGLDTNTGGRLGRLKPWIGKERFMVTYGDGVGSVDIRQVLATHEAAGKLATITAVRPPARFGSLSIRDSVVTEFSEKSQTHEGWINGGFAVFEPAVLDMIPHDDISLEHDVLTQLAADGQLAAYSHDGFWHPMDTLRDRQILEGLCAAGTPPWFA